MKTIKFLLFAVLLTALLPVGLSSCGKDDDKETNTIVDKKDEDNPEEEKPVDNRIKVQCYECFGDGLCTTCGGSGKGCPTCHGTGTHCDQCDSTGKFCSSCSASGKCSSCKGSGIYCSDCKGSGKCSTCNGTADCEECNGSGKEECYICDGLGRNYRTGATCYKCGGSGRIACGWCRGTGTCQRCLGERTCRQCHGNPQCQKCKGDGLCAICKGNPVCSVCGGKPVCKTCNGDGHCPTCNGKKMCSTCSGLGYSMEQPMKNYLQCPDNQHPHLIDLGLPSGTKWACCNVGARRPEDFGNYYAWGYTEAYDGSSYKYGYYDENGDYQFMILGENIAGTKYDVAHMKWGGTWQMPTFEQLEELLSITHKIITFNEVQGCIFTGTNGGSVFFPAAGYWFFDEENPGEGSYWSSSMPYNAARQWPIGLFFSPDAVNPNPFPGHVPSSWGLSVRAVEAN